MQAIQIVAYYYLSRSRKKSIERGNVFGANMGRDGHSWAENAGSTAQELEVGSCAVDEGIAGPVEAHEKPPVAHHNREEDLRILRVLFPACLSDLAHREQKCRRSFKLDGYFSQR